MSINFKNNLQEPFTFETVLLELPVKMRRPSDALNFG